MEKAIQKFNYFSTYISSAVLLLMVVFDTGDVVGRYLFGKPIKGGMEIQELMMICVVFLALGLCTTEKQHVMVDVLVSHLKGKALAYSNIFASLIGLVISSLMFWQTFKGAWSDIQSHTGESTPIVGIPIVPFTFIADLGLLLMSLSFIFQLVIDINKVVKAKHVEATKEVLQNG